MESGVPSVQTSLILFFEVNMKLQKFSEVEHIETGSKLLDMDRMINAISLQLAHAYGANSTETKRARRIRSELLQLRSQLENRLCSERPDMRSATHVYFGTPESRAHFGIVAKLTQPV